ncbi:uncharacterized protein LOC113356280 [Papaver somniferum]|uniref:uncharacterized protein LOC113356280 n=1 Tax=Papaver somniferum TaxID=3469 RepID=UPI000E6F7B45|nr:uncharacterized protein LOC113356280 [Papaver somniferum]
MGFGGVWPAWIRNCLSYSKISVLVNGSAHGFFSSSKGLRQGDPLSLFLFTIVGEVLSHMLNKAQQIGKISGFSVKNGGIKVNHFPFADDTSVFLDVKHEQVDALLYLLLCFELTSGLKINFSKSCLFGVALNEDIDGFASMLGCKRSNFPSIYLGLPLGDKVSGSHKWEKIVEFCASRRSS